MPDNTTIEKKKQFIMIKLKHVVFEIIGRVGD
jgi:hypothetical protein